MSCAWKGVPQFTVLVGSFYGKARYVKNAGYTSHDNSPENSAENSDKSPTCASEISDNVRQVTGLQTV